MGWATGIHLLPKGPRCSGADALEVAKSSWEGLRDSEVFKGVLGLEDGFDVVLECTGVESCMQMAVMVSPSSPFPFPFPSHFQFPFQIACTTIHQELTSRPQPLGPK